MLSKLNNNTNNLLTFKTLPKLKNNTNNLLTFKTLPKLKNNKLLKGLVCI